MTIRNNTATAVASSTASTEAPAYNATLPVRATIAAWCALSGMSRSRTYEALGTGHLHAVKLGTRVLIDVAQGLAWLNSLPPAAIGPYGANRTKQDA